MHNNFDLIQFLQENTFSMGSFHRRLPLSIRETIYHQYLPITTRPPEKGELEPVYPHKNYYFRTKEEFEENQYSYGERFLERGEFNGHFYRTVIPFKEKNFGVYFEEATHWLAHPPPSRQMSFKKAIGMVRGVDVEDIPDDDLETHVGSSAS